jgi:peptidoglycan/xylan/chitin deacetylase (PgdA/CDA1 family)
MYHRVSDDRHDPYGLSVSPAVFDEHMRYLRATCEVMTLEALADAIDRKSVPDRAVAVTLDDGYLDNLTTASPILMARGLPATFFITTEGIDEEREFWWDTLERRYDDRSELMAAHAALRELGVSQRQASLRRIVDARPALRPAQSRPLVRHEIRELASRPGHVVGVHTVHHLSLPRQPTSVQDAELRKCRETLEAVVGRPVTSVAYPFGEWSVETTMLAARAGLSTGAGVTGPAAPGRIPGGSSRLCLPRVDVLAAGMEFGALIDRVTAGP